MKLTPTSRLALGKLKPRSMTPFTTLNIVVTPQMPSASTTTARAQNDFFLHQHAQAETQVAAERFGNS